MSGIHCAERANAARSGGDARDMIDSGTAPRGTKRFRTWPRIPEPDDVRLLGRIAPKAGFSSVTHYTAWHYKELSVSGGFRCKVLDAVTRTGGGDRDMAYDFSTKNSTVRPAFDAQFWKRRLGFGRDD